VCFVDALVTIAPQLANLERPWLGPYCKADHELLVPGLAPCGSLALIPLRRQHQLDGVLVFSSSDPFRFTQELASDFLAHLGLVAAICVENAVNRARLLRSGLTDFLTGFHNRRYLHARLREELARAQRGRHTLACLMIDVDHFKRINDQYGHLAGDDVLREVAHRIDGQMRISDTGARFGGDEFAIVLSQATVAEADRVAGRVLQAVRSEPIAVSKSVSETVTLSIGVAAAKPGGGKRDYKALAERLMAEADAALYRAKSSGRNRFATSPNVVT
jgi:diguanylate cyclase (GGDEF)-like protein